MESFLGWLLVMSVLSVLGGAQDKTTVVLMPDADGQVGQVEVITDAGKRSLTEAGQMTTVKDRSQPPSEVAVVDKAQLQESFAAALSAEPEPPDKFLLYFLPDSTELTTASLELFPKILGSIEKRESSFISIFGHSDRVGSAEYNYSLSMKRARAVKTLLEEEGVDFERLETDSHGEGNPLIETADNVAEPRNRRVEVIVR
jgi:outer membrane protein OmpA-like peptidoglycan-associated protein